MAELDFHKIKVCIIRALVADEKLMGILVLKGGNAIEIAYDLTSRGSADLDFSLEKDFTEKDLGRIAKHCDYLLNNEFNPEGYSVFDVKIEDRPKVVADEVRDFWGGYQLMFKVLETSKYEELIKDGGIDAARRNAIPLGPGGSTVFVVDISKYEYVGGRTKKEIDGVIVQVYSPEMIVIEKIRALCQQVEEYKAVVGRMTSKSRARDFYDIHNMCTHYKIDLSTKENQELMRHIFGAKKVPGEFLSKISSYRELHRASWESVVASLSQKNENRSFDFYFDFVVQLVASVKL
jgi:hypothetical protein